MDSLWYCRYFVVYSLKEERVQLISKVQRIVFHNVLRVAAKMHSTATTVTRGVRRTQGVRVCEKNEGAASAN